MVPHRDPTPPTPLPRHLTLALTISVALATGPAPARAQLNVQLPDRVVSLDGAGYQRGNASAAVWIVEFADFGCGYCEKFWRETLPVLDSLYVKPGKVFWKFVPFTIGMFPNSGEAATTAMCAAEQGKFFAMHDLLYDKRKEWMKASDVKAQLARYAAQVRLDPAKYSACTRGKAVSEQLARNNALARTLYVRGTPTFFINGEVVPGAIPTESFVKGMDAVIKAYTGQASGRR